VPLGTRTVTGVVIATPEADSESVREVRNIIEVVDAAPFLPEDVLALVEWTAEYYACGVGAALAAAMPPRAWEGKASSFKTVRVATLTAQGHDPSSDRMPSPPTEIRTCCAVRRRG
jgi:primosomal protein N' (replication factor Y)